jgi:hypothetical protein
MVAVYKPKDLSKRYTKRISNELTKDIIPEAHDDSSINETESEKDQ